MKRTSSFTFTCSVGGGGIETTALHAYYTTVLTRAGNDVFTPVSRSDFGDLLGMLEVVGLAGSSLSAGSASPTKGKKSFGRSASFGTMGKIGGGEVKIAEGVRVDEVLRGLGIGISVDGGDVRQEEVSAIWEKERVRLGRDVKALEAKMNRGRATKGGVFADAMED
jgi:cell division control protein 6